MSFFDTSPHPDPETRYRERAGLEIPVEILRPPLNELGQPLDLVVPLEQRDDLAIAVTNVVVFSTGLTLNLRVLRRGKDLHKILRDAFKVVLMEGGEVTPDVLRFGVEFGDGRRASNLDAPSTLRDPPLVLTHGNGGYSTNTISDSFYWLWPLPPPGDLTFAMEWPALETGLVLRTIDAEAILEAGSRSTPLWDSPPIDD